MFERDLFDLFSRTHPAMVPLLFIPSVGALLWHGMTSAGVSALESAVLCVGGFCSWTLSEYWLHRKFFHWEPPGVWGKRLHFLVHGVHHRWPKDKYRLVMPPAVSISLFFIVLGVFFLLIGPKWVWPFHAGFVIGYITYDMTHYYIHHFTPKSRYGQRLKKNHMLHHFKSHATRFGVSSMVWDRVFGTQG